MTYRFSLIGTKDTYFTDEEVDALFEAGCNDSTPGMSHGVLFVRFSREAPSLELAIASAVSQVAKGCPRFNLTRVELEPEDCAELARAEG